MSPTTRVPLVATKQEGDGVTSLELLFDLVYVLAFTQVTALMAKGEAPLAYLDGFIVFALLWWTWSSYAWLANQVRANHGITHKAMVLAMVAMFVACMAIPEVFADLGGPVHGATAFVVCYGLVRALHLVVYLAAAGEDAALRRRVLLSAATSALPAVSLLAVGVALGEPWLRWVWLGAVLYDLAVIFIGARGGGGWVVNSAAHFAERHATVMMLALGESVVAIAVGVAQEPLSWPIVVASALAIAVSVGLWHAYFHRLDTVFERGLASRTGPARAELAAEVFTYLHLPIVGGVILAALGVEQAMAHLETDRVGVLGAVALGVGLATSLLASCVAAWRSSGEVLGVRVGAAVALALLALAGSWPPVALLGAAAAVLWALAVVEGRKAPGRTA